VAAAPLISVLIATRDAARGLPRCLESLRGQSFRDFEVVVMDGGSADGTVELLKAAGDVVATWRSEPDRGIYSAWNKALALARGEWICFLGADDWLWDARALERLAPALRSAPPDCRVVYSRLRQVDPQGRVAEELGEPWAQAKARFRSHVCLPQPGLMHRRTLFAAHGRFDESFQLAADYELLLRELKSGDALYVPAVTVGMALGGKTTSRCTASRRRGCAGPGGPCRPGCTGDCTRCSAIARRAGSRTCIVGSPSAMRATQGRAKTRTRLARPSFSASRRRLASRLPGSLSRAASSCARRKCCAEPRSRCCL
jgi:hypothetical protein